MAVTNQHSSIYLICQLIAGILFPGRPVANMVFVTYGYISSAQGIKFAADLKLGHYMKIPPRILFSVQLVATVISSLTQIAVLNWYVRFVLLFLLYRLLWLRVTPKTGLPFVPPCSRCPDGVSASSRKPTSRTRRLRRPFIQGTQATIAEA
jgi:hypothetical protein